MTETQAAAKMEVIKILEICRDIEIAAAELYHYYSEIYSDTPEIAQLWKKTAQEEENHAHQFALAITLRREGIVKAVKVRQLNSERILDKIRSVTEAVRRSKPAIADALSSAIKMEEKLSDYHMSTMAVFQEESHKELFEAMMRNDRGHVVELGKAYQKLMANQK